MTTIAKNTTEALRAWNRRGVHFMLAVVGAMLLLTACSDMLEQDSDHVTFADDRNLNSDADTVYSVTGIINKMQAIADRTILLGELRGDLARVTDDASSDLHEIAQFRVSDKNIYNSPRDYYAVINNCNFFLAKADTALKNSRNEYIFMKEFAAVKAFRAWTYLQLALNYKEVPLVTEPILNEGDTERDYPIMGIKELCDYFIADIAPYANIETPGYLQIRNTDSKLFFFSIYALLGDLNLWAGHYREAAMAYYNYLYTPDGIAHPTQTSGASWMREDGHWNSYQNSLASLAFSNEDHTIQIAELMTMIPGDSIPSEGNYSQLRNIFNSTTDNGFKVSIMPTQSLLDLSAAQTYCQVNKENEVIYAPKNMPENLNGDLRLATAWSKGLVISNNETFDYITTTKYNLSVRNVHLYRRTMVYLRLAEALNRAGFPRFAFAILKTGVNNEVIQRDVVPYYPDEAAWLSYFDFPSSEFIVRDVRRTMTTANTIGLHSRGCGFTEENEFYTMPVPFDSLLNAGVYTQAQTDSVLALSDQKAAQIEAVEDLIMDEEALEFFYEGHRFYDLMRVALRRNAPSYLANKIYNRLGADSYSTLRSTLPDLTDTDNWYLNWNNQIGPKR